MIPGRVGARPDGHRRAIALIGLTGSVFRTAWLILGVAVGFLFLLDWMYLGQAAVRERLRGAPDQSEVNPNVEEPWWKEWVVREGAVNGPSRYDPYRGWWARPYSSRYIHVDSAGRRVTIPGVLPGAARHRVLFLGGSVMWGYTVPDSLTIPSLVASRLHAIGRTDVEVLNLAQPAYNVTQGLITLMLELRSGARPDAVVSLDGSNDVLAALTEGHPGAALGEADLARRSAVGARGFWAGLIGLTRYSALLQRLAKFFRAPRVGRADAGEAPRCDTTAAYYANMVGVAERLGTSYGFTPLFLWQPHWATSRKQRTPWEEHLRAMPGLPEFMRRCSAQVESVMTARGQRGFVSLTTLFDHDSATIFLDEYGHLTPLGHRRIADRVVTLLAGRLGSGP